MMKTTEVIPQPPLFQLPHFTLASTFQVHSFHSIVLLGHTDSNYKIAICQHSFCLGPKICLVGLGLTLCLSLLLVCLSEN